VDNLHFEHLWAGTGGRPWHVRNDTRALGDFLKELGQDPEEATEVLGRITLSSQLLVQLRKSLKNDALWPKAVTILAMRGSLEDLSNMLASPDVNVQNQAMLYAAYNPAVAQYLDKYSGTKESTMVHSYLDRQRQLRDSLGRIAASVPGDSKGYSFIWC
jgi:hypothetical protein